MAILDIIVPTLAAAMLASTARARLPAQADFAIAPDPTWVLEAAVPVPAEPSTLAETRESEVLLEDHQILLGRGPLRQYWRSVRRVHTTSGVQNSSEPEVDFDPSYQELTLHHALLRRGSRTLDVLDPASVHIIQAESEREQRMYSGQLTAIVFLRDVRPGDTIDFAWSIVGANPIFGDRFSGDLDLALGEPARRLRHLLIRPRARRPPRWLAHGSEILPREFEQGGLRFLEWAVDDARPPQFDSDLPPDLDPFPFVEVSEFADWSEVGSWAAELFRYDREPAPPIQALLEELRRGSGTAEEAAHRAILFVQDQIRYLGIEIGVNSHAPHEPEQVLEWRFGDCKDKSLLLSLLLRGLGHKAWPALVNTRLRAELDHHLPSPLAFDHAIVKAEIGGKTLWLDPTRSEQGGRLHDRVVPTDARALVVGAGTAVLEEIPLPTLEQPGTEIEENWQLLGSEARLAVTARYRGQDADDMRSALAQRSPGEVASDYLNQYARYDSAIRVMRPLVVEDDREHNVLTTREAYALPDFRRAPQTTLHAWLLEPQLKRPRTLLRRLPLAVAHPIWMRQIMHLSRGEQTPLPATTEIVLGPAFRFELRRIPGDATTRYEFEYRSLGERVAPERVPEHLRALDELGERLRVDLGAMPATLEEPGLIQPTALLWFGLGAFSLLLMQWLRRKRASA